MRKLKSNKKSKKALEKQAKKDWIALDINGFENQKLQLAMYLTNFSVVAGKHFEIWKKSDDEHDNCTNEVLLGKIQLMPLMAEQLRKQYLDDVDIRPTKENIPIIAMTMGLCHECFGHTLPLSEEDKLQRLPAGFMATVGAMARTIQAMFDDRFEETQIKLGMLDDLNILCNLVTHYLNYLNDEIVWHEHLKRNWDEKAMFQATTQMMIMLNKELEKGSFEDKALFEEQEQAEKQITMEEKHMKTDKELIKDMLEKEAKKTKTKKAGRPKKIKTEEVVETPVVVEEHPENPSHYNQLGFNTIELIAGHLGKLGAFYFYLGNTFKYLLRAEVKNGKEDYIKAKQYLEWIVENAEVVGKTKAVDEILAGLETNWLNVSITLSGNMAGAKALLLNAIFESFFNKKYQIALDQLNLLLESE